MLGGCAAWRRARPLMRQQVDAALRQGQPGRLDPARGAAHGPPRLREERGVDLGFQGRRVLVVGASAGIGFATAELLAREGRAWHAP